MLSYSSYQAHDMPLYVCKVSLCSSDALRSLYLPARCCFLAFVVTIMENFWMTSVGGTSSESTGMTSGSGATWCSVFMSRSGLIWDYLEDNNHGSIITLML